MIWRTLHYDFLSAALLLLLLIPLAYSFIFLYQDRKKKMQAFASPPILEAILEKRAYFWLKTFLYCLAWICGVIALMEPKGNERYAGTSASAPLASSSQTARPLRKKAHEVILLIDASSSMNVADVSGKTRLESAKAIADDLMSRLKGENISLFAFTGTTMQIVPSTLDYLFTRLMLRQIQINEGETEGTNIKQALDFVKNLYFEKPSSTTKTIILFSDGGDTRLVGLSTAQTKQAIQEIMSPIANAEENHLRVFVVGIGSASGATVPGVSFHGSPVISALEEPLLRKLSIAGRGDLFLVSHMTSLQIAQKLAQNIAKEESFIDAAEAAPDQQDNTHLYDLYFQIPLGIAILALAGCLFLPDTRRKRSALLSLVFLLGNESLHSQDPTRLAQAYFESGDYPQAEREYELLLDEDMPQWQQDILQYNIGTALLAQGSWEEAMPHLQATVRTSLPLLKQRASANLAAARLMQLNSQLNTLPKDSPISIQLFLLFRQALFDMEKSRTAECELEALEGAATCPPINIENQKAHNYLESIVHSLTESRPMKTRIEDAIAFLYHKNDLPDKNRPSDPSPAAFLEKLIAQEEFLLLLYQLKDDISSQSKENFLDNKELSLPDLQHLTITQAQAFPKLVLSHQQTAFSNSNSTSRCQCQPWNEVIPLFFSGYGHAVKAAANPKPDNPDLQENSSLEKSIQQAIVSWKEALTKMRAPPSQKELKQPENKPSQSEPEPDQKSLKEVQNEKLYDLLRTLQDMEQDDKSKPAFKTAPTREEDRPW